MTRATDEQRLTELEAAFAYNGGRGVDLADEIDTLRARLSPRRFYRRVVQVEILSEYEDHTDDLTDIAHNITDGEQSGNVTEIASEVVDGPAMAALLMAQGSDPSFFRLDKTGGNLADDEWE